MKSKAGQLNHRDILLFDTESGLFPSNSVKQFFHFLKYSGIRGHIKFAHAHDQASLHKNINIRQNIIMESQTQDTFGLEEENFEAHLNKLSNKYLSRLIKRVFPLDRFPYQLNEEERKIAVLVKALLCPCDYIFLDSPEKNLNEGNLNIFKQSLIYESYYSNKTVLITSMEKDTWLDMATKVVYKTNHFEFTCQSNEQKNKKVLEFIDEYQKKNQFQWEVVDDKKVS